jgi:hypothetical protein
VEGEQVRVTRALVAGIALVALVVPAAAAGTLSEGSDLSSGLKAIELKAPVPDWYTPALHEQVVAAGRQGKSVPLPAEAGIEMTGLAFTGIRPGAWIIFPAGCTTNFVFGGGTQIGTAGHCAGVGDEVTLIAAPGVLMNIGTVSRSIDNGIGDDFALINIYTEMQQYVNPSMTHFAGPTGATEPVFGDAVVHSGHGLVIGTGGTPRAGVVTYVGPGDFEGGGGSGGGSGGGEEGGNGNGNGKNCEKKPENCNRATLSSSLAPSGDTAYGWDGAAMLGDSGSGVRDATGAAAGNLTHLVVGTQYLPAFIVGTTAPYIEQLAGMPITTASLVPDPLW